MKKLTGTRRIAVDALLTAFALTIFVIELNIPYLMPVPGVKPGLSNIVTLAAFFISGPADAAFVLISRVVLGCMFSGQIMALAYSLAGGMLCYAVTFILYRLMNRKQIFILGITGAIAHNAGQIIAAIIITGTRQLVSYFPLLTVSAIISGTFTGYAAQCAVNRLAREKAFVTGEKNVQNR